VSVFNLVDGSTVSLKTADGSQGVIENVAANSSGHREVNPVKANLALYSGATKVADAKPMTLERGKTFSLFVTGSATQPVLIWSVN
jgi:alginate O-acetyltransferase complex protein AlgF